MSLKELRPVFTFETMEEPSSLVMYTVIRSASNSWQMSRETSRMISSTFCVEWMRLVTAWSLLEKASFTAMSDPPPDDETLVSRTALMVAPASCWALQREFLVVFQHAWPPPAGRVRHFLH